ncbi:uncharacterized protein LOC107041060 [Diachasma alloeum]|uniref:uncharacterized protein LOC107041060 n=1 Tax=Diachasma alloeum TaxID=454923 RepID=UPI0007381C1E|nr:uncharacterized protein LOC107041060 [Diachasma alloeum]
MSGMSGTKVLCSNIGPSHVSSNGYYGYVPPIGEFPMCPTDSRGENASVCVQNYHKSDDLGLTTIGGVERAVHSYQENYYSTMSMEMETEEHCSGMGMCCQNNHYVIPEMASGGKAVLGGGVEGMSFHGSRKRNCEDGGEPGGRELLMKRFKGGGGNSRVDHGPRNPREPRSPQMHNDTSPLYITPHPLTLTCHSMLTNDRCTQAAGKPHNSHFVNNEIIDCERVSDRCTSAHGNEYETMLMETHGCSVYHHQRQLQFDNGTIETEF